MAGRRAAAAQYDPRAIEFAPGELTPSEQAGEWHRIGDMFGYRFEDQHTLLNSFLARNVTVDGRHTEDLPVLKMCEAIPGRRKVAIERLERNLLAPAGRLMKRFASENGYTPEENFRMLDYAPTAYHTLTEGTPQHRRNIIKATERARTALEKAEAKGDQIHAARMRYEVRIGEETLRLHNEYNATGKPPILNEGQAALMSDLEGRDYREDDPYTPRVISGIPETLLGKLWNDLQKVFTEQQIMEFVNLVTKAYRELVEDQLRFGTLTMERVNTRPEYYDFVALNIMRNTSSLQGNYPSQYIYNPRPTDHRRRGSKTPAAGGMTNLFKAVSAAAESEARLPWDHKLPVWYEGFRDENGSYKTIEDRGLKRATLNDDETGFRERKYQKDAWIYMNAPGWIVRTEVNGKVVARKYFFDFKDPAETELMNKAIS
ncbi:MAG: hypothetical protein LBR80_14815 [Deltaproteobacteria bacterium]|jgi:hypothetical protein|nr:hypothetical protein [Deltaproteobacteria bacterium]